VPAGSAVGDLSSCVFLGTVVRGGAGSGVVVATGARAEFHRIASRPSRPLVVAALATVVVGVALPQSPLAPVLGFAHLPGAFLLALAGMVLAYLVLIELAKRVFFAE
jgi:molybdopterin biosynthesis enzyme